MRRRPPRSTRPDTLLPYTTHFLSQSDHQPKREHGIHQRFSELRALGIFMIDMDRRRVVGQRTEKHIVEVGYRLADFVDEFLPYCDLFEMQTCHLVIPPSLCSTCDSRGETARMSVLWTKVWLVWLDVGGWRFNKKQ